jgi:hypothetical protein
VPLVFLLILSLIGAGVARDWAAGVRGKTVSAGETNSATPLSRMDSFALGLLLGGLRGPLVMILWTSSESQKQQKDLEDFDTKVEWIRLLQPEFDTVHIFQIWNKAYNISVLEASLPNKYLTILDALDYADKVNRERPDDINIVYAIGGVFFDKLDQSSEKDYYRQRVREETLPHHKTQTLSKDDPAWRPLQLDAVLDDKGNILPDKLAPTSTLLTDPSDPTQRYDGSDLQFLAKYQPYPDGISPVALGYNYMERAAQLQNLGHQRHAQLSDMVVDSRPALALKFWAEEDLERGRQLELAALGRDIPSDRNDLEVAGSAIPLDLPLTKEQRAGLDHARSVYALVSRLAADSLSQFQHHVLRFMRNLATARIHMDILKADVDLAGGDRDYLAAILAEPSARPALLATAKAEYRRALVAEEIMMLRYYMTDASAKEILPPGIDRTTLEKIDPNALGPMVEELKRRALLPGANAEDPDDVKEQMSYIGRLNTRLAMIGH